METVAIEPGIADALDRAQRYEEARRAMRRAAAQMHFGLTVLAASAAVLIGILGGQALWLALGAAVVLALMIIRVELRRAHPDWREVFPAAGPDAPRISWGQFAWMVLATLSLSAAILVAAWFSEIQFERLLRLAFTVVIGTIAVSCAIVEWTRFRGRAGIWIYGALTAIVGLQGIGLLPLIPLLMQSFALGGPHVALGFWRYARASERTFH